MITRLIGDCETSQRRAHLSFRIPIVLARCQAREPRPSLRTPRRTFPCQALWNVSELQSMPGWLTAEAGYFQGGPSRVEVGHDISADTVAGHVET